LNKNSWLAEAWSMVTAGAGGIGSMRRI